MDWLLDAYDHSSEKKILNSVSREVPWKLVEYFSRLKRDSGTEGEREAARYITTQLESFGIPYQVYEPELYLSLPEWAKLYVLSPSAFEIRCKTPSFSSSTDGKAVEGNLVYVPTETGEKTEYLFGEGMKDVTQDVRGKIVLTEGVFAPRRPGNSSPAAPSVRFTSTRERLSMRGISAPSGAHPPVVSCEISSELAGLWQPYSAGGTGMNLHCQDHKKGRQQQDCRRGHFSHKISFSMTSMHIQLLW